MKRKTHGKLASDDDCTDTYNCSRFMSYCTTGTMRGRCGLEAMPLNKRDKGVETQGMMGLIVHAEVQYKRPPKGQTITMVEGP